MKNLLTPAIPNSDSLQIKENLIDKFNQIKDMSASIYYGHPSDNIFPNISNNSEKTIIKSQQQQNIAEIIQESRHVKQLNRISDKNTCKLNKEKDPENKHIEKLFKKINDLEDRIDKLEYRNSQMDFEIQILSIDHQKISSILRDDLRYRQVHNIDKAIGYLDILSDHSQNVHEKKESVKKFETRMSKKQSKMVQGDFEAAFAD